MAKPSGDIRSLIVGGERAPGEPYGVVVSVQGTAPGADFTYTITIQDPAAGAPITVTGFAPQRDPAWDYEARPAGYEFPVARYGERYRPFLFENYAVEECE